VPNQLVEPASGRNDPRRKILLDLFRAALESVDGRLCVRNALLAPAAVDAAADGGTAIGGGAAELSKPVWAAAVGKAACAMMLGAQDALGPALARALVITKDDHVTPQCLAIPNIEILESAHPMPDERSLAAGERLLQWVDEIPPDTDVLFLISGGASSLVESLVPGATFEQLTALNARGLASGMTIVELNAQRAKLSQIKGGRLAARVSARLAGSGTARALFISDVPGHDPAVIGSGLMGPIPTQDARTAVGAAPTRGTGAVLGASTQGPGATQGAATAQSVGATQGAATTLGPAAPQSTGTAQSDRIHRTIIASIDHAMERVIAEAYKCGLSPWRDARIFDGSADRLAVRFSHELHMSVNQLCVWGGESTVELPENPGRGGRNQHLALAAARIIAGHENLMLLVAGTDGTDGVTSDAGALVDGETCSRIALSEIDVAETLKRADSGTALAAAGDLIHTGPTGTNVGDIVIGLKLTRDAAAGLPCAS
jgi:hydroxypyruvate reductase